MGLYEATSISGFLCFHVSGVLLNFLNLLSLSISLFFSLGVFLNNSPVIRLLPGAFFGILLCLKSYFLHIFKLVICASLNLLIFLWPSARHSVSFSVVNLFKYLLMHYFYFPWCSFLILVLCHSDCFYQLVFLFIAAIFCVVFFLWLQDLANARRPPPFFLISINRI